MALPSLDVQIVTGYVLHYINFGADWDTAVRRAMDKAGVPPSKRGGVSSAVRNVLRRGTSVTDVLNQTDLTRPLSEALQGAQRPAAEVGVRVRFWNPETRQWVSQVVKGNWGMTMAQIIDIAYQSLQSYESGGPGVDKESYQVVGPTWLPSPDQR